MARSEHNSSGQLAAYRLLLENAHAMLDAARDERWDDLIEIDAKRAGCLAGVRQADLVASPPADSTALAEMMRSILDCDAQTQALVKVWQSEMTEVLGSMDNQRKLDGAYRSG